MGKKTSPTRVTRPGDPEPPTPQARLEISLSKEGGKAETLVPPGEAHHAVTTVALIAVSWAAIGGAVWTVQISPRLAGLALAELGFGFAMAIVIALCGHRRSERAN
jgi:hypothetical protein